MTDKKDLYASGEPGLSYDPLEVDEGWEPSYRNKNACFEQKLAKEIGEMSDEGDEELLNGGNTPERVEEQIEWLNKLAENKKNKECTCEEKEND